MSDTILVFRDRALADAILNEIAVTPGESIIEGGGAPVKVYDIPDGPVNSISYAEAQDGRVAIRHNWPEATSDWLRAYLRDYLADNSLPANAASVIEEDWITVQTEQGPVQALVPPQMPADWRSKAV